ncbi:hypothetical protein M6B38_395270 [Iris pallida]|uniref:Uncharacterized protein n=1 Tax=Iris pallida TaxID=29817 RepID=A0AAX6FYH6_IRIPA|nr:hypothetical protein M6B38_395270 [Iris pallida]
MAVVLVCQGYICIHDSELVNSEQNKLIVSTFSMYHMT